MFIQSSRTHACAAGVLSPASGRVPKVRYCGIIKSPSKMRPKSAYSHTELQEGPIKNVLHILLMTCLGRNLAYIPFFVGLLKAANAQIFKFDAVAHLRTRHTTRSVPQACRRYRCRGTDTRRSCGRSSRRMPLRQATVRWKFTQRRSLYFSDKLQYDRNSHIEGRYISPTSFSTIEIRTEKVAIFLFEHQRPECSNWDQEATTVRLNQLHADQSCIFQGHITGD